MNTRSDWYNDTVKKIDELKNTLSQKEYRRFRLDLLSCVADRVDQFSSECTQCMSFRQDVTRLVADAGNLAQTGDREGRKSYYRDMNRIIGHLQRQHKLVTEGYYVGLWMAIGTAIGVAMGAGMDNVGSGIPIGVGIGVAIGIALDAKAKKEGRILCLRKTTRFSKTALALLIVAGLLLSAGILAFILFNRMA